MNVNAHSYFNSRQPDSQTSIRQYIDEKHVDGSLMQRLLGLAGAELECVQEIIDQTNPSANTLRDFLRLLDETCARDNTEPQLLLRSSKVRDVLESDSLSKKEKQKKLRQYLEQLRYPAMTQLNDKLEVCCSKIVRELGLRLELPKDLEGDAVSVKISAKNSGDWAEQAERLQQLGQHPSMSEIFSILRGEY